MIKHGSNDHLQWWELYDTNHRVILRVTLGPALSISMEPLAGYWAEQALEALDLILDEVRKATK